LRPLAARWHGPSRKAQRPPMPVIGVLITGLVYEENWAEFREGLKEVGYVKGKTRSNVGNPPPSLHGERGRARSRPGCSE
jgi:hypothetical protein